MASTTRLIAAAAPAPIRRPIPGGLRFVATCPSCGGRISPDQVMCTACALSSTARA
ncbi:hypothetical protein [Lentzea sp. NPDC003310]|uniref:hypothetical protein n=1 Tax=Lentzea sp. NPDC003310 TaxID=3154447 RepID=UPI0033A056AA